VLTRLRGQAKRAGDPFLSGLHEELRGYPGGEEAPPGARGAKRSSCRCGSGWTGAELSFLSTTTVFGAPLDVTVAELAIESFYPADERTAAAVRAFTLPGA
jgi:hypothetical protein